MSNMTDLRLDELGMPLRPFTPEDMARMDMTENFRRYGRHPQCRGCREGCPTYAAPDSVIIYCPRFHKRHE